MSNCEKCEVCNSYTSAVREAFNSDEPCPHCGSTHETTVALLRAKATRERLESQKADKELIEKATKLEKENIMLSDGLAKMKEKLWHMDTLIEDFVKDWDDYKEFKIGGDK